MSTEITSDHGGQHAGTDTRPTDAREEFIVAVRREERDAIAPSWAEALGELEDVEVQGPYEGPRVTIRATYAAIETIRANFGSTLHIEHVVRHSTSAALRKDSAR